jgi:pimeloyl-ACP methyl ester carboxylesterase
MKHSFVAVAFIVTFAAPATNYVDASELAARAIVQPLAQVEATPKPPGRLVDIGGYRLHLDCTGKGSPTVVLAAGAGDFSVDWALVQPSVSKITRVCSYDRAGEAWSDAGPIPRTMRQEAFELNLAMKNLGEKGPYLLVGHSIAGLTMRIFAQMFPAQTAGMVLVDATRENAVLNIRGKLTRVRLASAHRPIPEPQTMKTSPPILATEQDRRQFDDFQKQFGRPRVSAPYNQLPADLQQVDLWARSQPPRLHDPGDYSAEEMEAVYADFQKSPNLLGSKPLFVLIGGRVDGPPRGMLPHQWHRLMDEKLEQKRQFARLSQNTQVEVVETAGHHIQLDDPQKVIDAIRDTWDSARTHKKLDNGMISRLPWFRQQVTTKPSSNRITKPVQEPLRAPKNEPGKSVPGTG